MICSTDGCDDTGRWWVTSEQGVQRPVCYPCSDQLVAFYGYTNEGRIADKDRNRGEAEDETKTE